MTNTFNTDLSAVDTANVAAIMTRDQLKIASLFKRFGEGDFTPGRGNTIYLPVRAGLTAHARKINDGTNGLIMDQIEETQAPVILDLHAYSAVALNEEDLALNIEDFAKQVLAPQTEAVGAHIENAAIEFLTSLPETDELIFDQADVRKLFRQGRSALRARGVDVANAELIAIIGGDLADAILDSHELDDVAATGDEGPLRNAKIGKLRGFTIVESADLGGMDAIFMTKDAIYLANRPPADPLGAAYSAAATIEGLGVRHLMDYDVTTTKDRSLVSTLYSIGLTPLFDVQRTHDEGVQGEEDYAAGTAEVIQVEGGAVVRAKVTTP